MYLVNSKTRFQLRETSSGRTYDWAGKAITYTSAGLAAKRAAGLLAATGITYSVEMI
jgi:hypothetical protein